MTSGALKVKRLYLCFFFNLFQIKLKIQENILKLRCENKFITHEIKFLIIFHIPQFIV